MPSPPARPRALGPAGRPDFAALGLRVGVGAALIGVAACGAPDKRPRVGARPTAPKMSIIAPISGAFLDEGAPVLLEMECRGADGAVVACGAPRWSLLPPDEPEAGPLEGWGAEGSAVEVDDLPAGAWLLWAEAEVAGLALDDERELYVFAGR